MGQNGWTRETKSFYGQLTFSTFQSSDYYSAQNKLFDQGATFNSKGLLLYGEYGIHNSLNAIINVPLLVVNYFSTTETAIGIGNARIGLKYRLFKNTPVAIQVEADIPTNDGVNLATSKKPNSLGFKDQINLPTSDGEFNIWTTLAASKSINSGKTFGSIYSSVNFRTENYSNQFLAGLEVGHLFFDKFYTIAKLSVLEKIKSNKKEEPKGGTFLYGEGTTFTQYNVTGIYKINKQFSLVGSYTNYADFIVKRGNLYSGSTFSIGVSVEY